MVKTIIDDNRSPSDFTSITFSGYKTTLVTNRLIDAMKKEQIETSCYWTTELLCAGHYEELWESIFHFYSKYIHIANPKLSIYIWTKLQRFKENMNNATNQQAQLDFRNDDQFRSMFIEIVAILCLSTKKYTMVSSKVCADDFSMIKLKTLLQAPNISFSEGILQDDDPKELIVTLNDFAFNLTKSVSNTARAYYWVEWVLEYVKVCRKKKQSCLIHPRVHIGVDAKYHSNAIWVIWDILVHESACRGDLVVKIIDSLLGMFTVRYSVMCNTRRRFIIYFAISVLTNSIAYDAIDIVADKKILACVMGQVDAVFLQVKGSGAMVDQVSTDTSTSDENVPTIPSTTSGGISTMTSNDKLVILNRFERGFVPRV